VSGILSSWEQHHLAHQRGRRAMSRSTCQQAAWRLAHRSVRSLVASRTQGGQCVYRRQRRHRCARGGCRPRHRAERRYASHQTLRFTLDDTQATIADRRRFLIRRKQSKSACWPPIPRIEGVSTVTGPIMLHFVIK